MTIPLNHLYRKIRDNHAAVMVIVAVLLLFGGQILNSNFISGANIGNILALSVILGLAAAGQTLVVTAAQGIDISAGSMMSLGAIMAVEIMKLDNAKILPCILMILLVGGIVGLLNALGIILARVPTLIMTLAMSNIIISVQMIYSKGTPTGKPAPFITFIGTTRIFPWLPWMVILGFLMILFMHVLMNRTIFGSQFFATGSNKSAAYLAGIRTNVIIGLVFVLSGMMAGMAGFWFAAYNTFININIANHFVLPAVAAVLIGGSPFSGGKGNYAGTMIGAIVLTLLSTLLIMIRVGEAGKFIINGTILIALLALYNREPPIRQ